MNDKNTFNDKTALSDKLSVTNANTTNNEEETAMTNKKNIFDAIQEIKADWFRQDMITTAWEIRDINLDYFKMFQEQDDIAVIRLFKQSHLSDNEFRRIIHRFCEMGDSKRRCRELAAAFDHGDFIVKKGHIDGRLIIIVQILVD